MKWIRRIAIWAVLLAIGLLVILSIHGAFLGVKRARALFNSVSLVVFWCVLLGLFLVGLAAFKRLLRSPGLLLAHLGSVLILAGAMLGSDKGHAAARRLLDLRRIPAGLMTIYEGDVSSIVQDDEGRPIGRLPFSVALKDFRVEYYEDDGPWWLVIDAPPLDDSHPRRQQEIRWTVGSEAQIPIIGGRVKVLRYLPGARLVFAEPAACTLEVTQADGKKTVLPAEVGQEVSLGKPQSKLKIVGLFSNFKVQHGKAIDVPGPRANPAVKIEFLRPDGKNSHGYVFASGIQMHGLRKDGLDLRMLPEPTVQPDPGSRLPAMEVLATYKGRKLRDWLLAQHPEVPAELSLAPLLGQDAPADAHGHTQRVAHLMMVTGRRQIKDYKSRLVVMEEMLAERQKVLEKEIEVNDPLHYGGYHLYQSGYDDRHHRYTVLSVKSDLGLWPVYAGFALLCAGVFWQCWVQPVWRHFRRPKA